MDAPCITRLEFGKIVLDTVSLAITFALSQVVLSALLLLRSKTPTVQQILNIAQESGLRSLNSFNKAFKDTYQMTPGSYRGQHTGDPQF